MIDLGQFLRTLFYQLPVARFKAFYNRIMRMTFKVTKLVSNPKAEALLNQMMAALKVTEPEARIQALLPLMHKSTYYRKPDGTLTLDRNILEFSLKKALAAINMYADPVRVKEVHRGNTMTVGFGEFVEKGREDKYFICRKDDLICQYPVPIVVFWPEGDDEHPTIRNFGSM